MGKRNPAYYENKAKEATKKLQDELDHANYLLEKFRKTAEQAHDKLMYGRLGHSELAGQLFMLQRSDLNHVSLTQAGRDRIIWLAGQLHDREQQVAALQLELDAYTGAGQPKYQAPPKNAPITIVVDGQTGAVSWQLADNYKILRNTTAAERNWPAGTGDNDNYQNLCCHCSRTFIGYKRAASCRACAEDHDREVNKMIQEGIVKQDATRENMANMLAGKISVDDAFAKEKSEGR